MNDAQEHEREDFETQARIRWSELTEADLEHVKDSDATFVHVLAARLGIDEATAESQISAWSHEMSDVSRRPAP